MKARPILFNTDMVKAILDGRKTQTRQPASKRVVEFIEMMAGSNDDNTEFDFLQLEYGHLKHDNGEISKYPQWLIGCSEYPEDGCIPIGQGFGAVGDRLWVRETWFQKGRYCMPIFDGADHEDAFWSGTKDVKYFASEDVSSDGHVFGEQFWRKRPSIHMPRWACRLVLEITNVRLERIQDITEDDAKAEGTITAQMVVDAGRTWRLSDHRQFKNMWDTVYPNSWESNEWVWVIEFKIVELNGKKQEQAA